MHPIQTMHTLHTHTHTLIPSLITEAVTDERESGSVTCDDDVQRI